MSHHNSLLEIKGLTITTQAHGNKQVLVDTIALQLQQGSIHGLVGESGSGKTMIANAVAGLLPEGMKATGNIIFRDIDLLQLDPAASRQVQVANIGYIFQNPKAALNPRLTVGDHLREALKPELRQNETQALQRALALLQEVGISNAYSRLAAYPHELSGGLAQRVVIAMALARDPAILIADEPTTALDMTIQAQILDLIQNIQLKRQFGVLLITHDMGIIRDRADIISVVAQGKIVETGSSHAIFTAAQAQATKSLIAGALLDEAFVSAEAEEVDAKPLYRIKNLRKVFDVPSSHKSAIHALNDVSLDIFAGRSLGIVGESGSGKTTLARMLLGLAHPDSGEITYQGLNKTGLSREQKKQWRRSIQFVFQDHWASFNPYQSILESIAEPLRADGVPQAQRVQRVLEVMKDVSLPDSLAHRKPAQLSGGQLQRAAIARALVVRPQILVADEPVASLDVTIQSKILKLLEFLKVEHGINYIIISHDLRIVKRISQDLIVMKDGVILERGKTRDIFIHPQHAYTRQLLAATPGLTGEAQA